MPPGTIELSGCAPRAGGHRFEAPGVSLPLGTVARLGEDQDRGVAGGEPRAVEAASEALSGLHFTEANSTYRSSVPPRQRIAAVRTLEAMGYVFRDEWIAPAGQTTTPTAEADAMQACL